MSNNNAKDARLFYAETNFQNKARRRGGIPRDEAISNAETKIDALKPDFAAWLDQQIDELVIAVPDAESIASGDLAWIDAANLCSQRLADVAATMDYPLVSFVASNLCTIFEATRADAKYHGDVIICHINALLLARQDQYRKMRAEDLPELSDGLRRVVESPRLQPKLDDGK